MSIPWLEVPNGVADIPATHEGGIPPTQEGGEPAGKTIAVGIALIPSTNGVFRLPVLTKLTSVIRAGSKALTTPAPLSKLIDAVVSGIPAANSVDSPWIFQLAVTPDWYAPPVNARRPSAVTQLVNPYFIVWPRIACDLLMAVSRSTGR
jgi:hypothetical protein